MMSMLLPLAILALLLPPQSPDATLPPPNAHLALTAEGLGVQIYRCTPQNAGQPGGTFKWVFEAPEATLCDPATHQSVGSHSAGPTWHWNDGSEVVGKVLQTAPASDPANIPWLLLEAHSTGTAGVLSNVVFIRRTNTQAGAAPSYGCDAERNNNTIRVPYEATYTFYTTN
jgi:hypothetical protein